VRFGALRGAVLLCTMSLPFAWGQPNLPFEPSHESGSGITGSFEGWFKNSDGSFDLLVGYFNRNQKQELEIPVGANNRIEPGGPDRGQPTHFLIGRQWGMFVIKVPSDFGDKKLSWTLTANGMTSSIPLSLKTEYEIAPFLQESGGNTPPILKFEEKGPSVQGPTGLTIERTTKPGVPVSLTTWVADDGKWTTLSGAPPRNLSSPVSVRWTKFRGPGNVTFDKDRPDVEKIPGSAFFTGKATANAMFDQPGEYILHVVANDLSGDGGGGEQCCWSFGNVRVSVTQ
jgi:hypothetical protein